MQQKLTKKSLHPIVKDECETYLKSQQITNEFRDRDWRMIQWTVGAYIQKVIKSRK